jgi:hypothetical protein
MASNRIFRFGPIALTTTLTQNLLNPATATGGVNAGSSSQYIILRRVRITNKTANSATFSLWLGATGANAAGTELFGTATPVAANSAFDWGGQLRIDAADFLVGGSGTATALTISGEGEVGVAG